MITKLAYMITIGSLGVKKRLGTIDLDTGELVEGVPVWVGGRPRIHEGWLMTFQEALEELAKDKDLKGEHWRVFSYLLSQLDFENFIQVPQKKIAEALGMNKVSVSRAIALLSEKKIILRGPKVARSSCFRLNPNYGWKGKVKNFKEAQRDRLELVTNNSGD